MSNPDLSVTQQLVLSVVLFIVIIVLPLVGSLYYGEHSQDKPDSDESDSSAP